MKAKKTKSADAKKDKSSARKKKRPKTLTSAKPQLDTHGDIPSRLEKQIHEWKEHLPKGTWRS